MPCFDLGFCKSLQKGRARTVTIEPEKTLWEETGGWIKIQNHSPNSLTPKEMSSKDVLHLPAVTLHCKSSESVLLEPFDPCLVFAWDLHQWSLPKANQGLLPHGNGAYGTRTTSHILGCAVTFLVFFLLKAEAFLCAPFLTENMGCVLGWGLGSAAGGHSTPPGLPPSLITLTLLSHLSSGDAHK